MAIHIEDENLKVSSVQRLEEEVLCAYGDSTKPDEQVLVSLNVVFDRGERVDRVLQLLFMGSFAFVAIFKRVCRIL